MEEYGTFLAKEQEDVRHAAEKPCVDLTSAWQLICSNDHNQVIILKTTFFIPLF